MATEVIIEQTFDTAAAFLAALRPSDDRWKADPGLWVFRGHADARWRLFPSQNRRSALASYFGTKYRSEDPNDHYCQPDPVDLATLGAEFVFALDEAGYVVPGSATVPLKVLAERMHPGRYGAEGHAIGALAQHHGLPTHLLDWTRHSNIAAYFAASETAYLPGELTGQIEVWALNKSIGVPGTGDAANPMCLRVLSPLRGENANLHAQGGLFTYVSVIGNDGLTHPVDEVVRAIASNSTFAEPVMYRLKCPRSEAGELLHLLSYEPVSGASLFPGVGGVVREVRDRLHFPQDVRLRLPRPR